MNVDKYSLLVLIISAAVVDAGIFHQRQMLVSANSRDTTTVLTHFLVLPGDPNTWIYSSKTLSITDIPRNSLRWEKLAFSYHQRYIVFTEASSRTVNLLYLVDEDEDDERSDQLVHHPILKTGIGGGGIRISSLDVDWISDVIYVAEEKGIIYSVKITPTLGHYSPDVHIGVVYNGSLVPIAVRTDPSRGYLYTIMRDRRMPYIHRYHLSGVFDSVLVTHNLTNPTDLTIDYTTDILYWVDNLPDSMCEVEALDLRTEHRWQMSLIENCQSNSIDFSVNYLLIANNLGDSIHIKVTNTSAYRQDKTIPNLRATPHSLVMYDGYRQTLTDDGCSVNNGGCEVFCYTTPVKHNEGRLSQGYECGCQFGYMLNTDAHTCDLDLSSLQGSRQIVVTDSTHDGTQLYIIDINNEMTIPLPIRPSSHNITYIQRHGDVIYWCEGTTLQSFSIITGVAKTVYTSTGIIWSFAVINDLIYMNHVDNAHSLLIYRNSSIDIINHGLYRPRDILASADGRYLYISLMVSMRGLADTLTDRVVRYKLDGTDRTAIESSSLTVTSITIDAKGTYLFSVHRSQTSDMIYMTDLMSGEHRIITMMMSSHIEGQLSIESNYLYYYSSEEQRALWKLDIVSGYNTTVVSGRIFRSLRGGLSASSRTTSSVSGRSSACLSDSCSEGSVCLPSGSGAFLCKCVDNSKCQPGADLKSSTEDTLSTSFPPTDIHTNSSEDSLRGDNHSITIISATVGVCVIVILSVCLIFPVILWRSRKKGKGEPHIQVGRQASSSLHSCHTSHSARTPSNLSIINTPLPDLPCDQYSEANHHYELIPPTMYNAPGSLFLSTSSIDSTGHCSHISCTTSGVVCPSQCCDSYLTDEEGAVGDVPTHVAPRPNLTRLISDSYADTKTTSDTLWHKNSVYHDSGDYLSPVSGTPHLYLQVKPVPNARASINTSSDNPQTTELDRSESEYINTSHTTLAPESTTLSPECLSGNTDFTSHSTEGSQLSQLSELGSNNLVGSLNSIEAAVNMDYSSQDMEKDVF